MNQQAIRKDMENVQHHKYNAGLGFILTALLLAALSTGSAPMAANATAPVFQSPTAAKSEDHIYILKKAGIQFEVPKGWKAVTDMYGDLKVSPASKGSGISATFIVPEEGELEKVLTDLRNSLKEDDLKLSGERKNETLNGMTNIVESGTGDLDGSLVQWSINVITADKPVVIFSMATVKALDDYVDDYTKLMKSIRKIKSNI